MRLLLPWMMASESRIATMEEVITTLLIDACFKEELRIERVPWMAGSTISLSVSSVFSYRQFASSEGQDGKGLTSLGSGLATCNTPTTSFNTPSKAPSTVMSGTTTNSTAFLETKGAILG